MSEPKQSGSVDTESKEGITVLVLASTFPARRDDTVPAFVRDQVEALVATSDEAMRAIVLAPHDSRSRTVDHSIHARYEEYRFHYAWPKRFERLAGRGIMPTLRSNRLLYLLIPSLIWRGYRAALRLARDERPFIIYAHWFTPQAMVAYWVSKRTGIPFVFTTHASDVEVWGRFPLFGKALVRRVTSRARAITAVSTRSAAKLSQFIDASEATKISIVPMGVNVVAASQVARNRFARKDSTGSEVRFLFIGRLVEKKGLRGLLNALQSINARLPSWRLTIAGDGPLDENLRDLTVQLGLDDRVKFVGYTVGPEKDELFAQADIMVIPSIVAPDGDAEGLPVTLLEGLAHGLCCVATHESGADDIVSDGLDGILCSQTIPGSLEKALLEAVALGPSGRETMASRGRELAESFSWEKIARRHHEILFPELLRSVDEVI